MKKLLWLAILLILIAALTGCNSGNEDLTETPVVQPTLTFEESDMTLNVGDVVALALTREGTGRELVFLSSDESVVTVDEDGMLIAIAEGNAVITTNMNGVSATLNINVVMLRVISIELHRNVFSIGDTVEFDVLMNPDDGTSYTVSFVLADIEDDEPKAVLNNSIVVTEAGMHTITVTSEDASSRIQFIVFDLDEFYNDVFMLTNLEREKAGLYPLAPDPDLDAAADIRVLEIVERFSHTRPDDSMFATAFLEADVTAGSWAENLASGQRTPEDVIACWMESITHREAMLHEDYKYLGIGIHMDENGKVYWVQTFRG